MRFRYTSSGVGLPPITGLVPLIIGAAFLVSLAYYEATYFFFGETTAGVIDRFERPLRTTYVIVRFQDARGREQILRQTLLMRERFSVGEAVRVRYLPDEPARGRIETFWQFWHPLILKPTIGLLSLWAAVALFRRRFCGLSEVRPPSNGRPVPSVNGSGEQVN